MGFVPPLNLGGFQPSPATLAQWVYQIWQYLQENPIATQEQIKEFIGTFITTSPETQTMIGEGVEQYLTENPPQAPVQSVQGKTGAVTLNYPDIVPASNAVPVYRAASAPSTSTSQGLYNNGYRLFVNTATQEIYTISNSGALALVGRGRFDGTTVDLDTAQGDTTISEAVTAIEASIGTLNTQLAPTLINAEWISGWSGDLVAYRSGNVVTVAGFINRTSQQTEFTWANVVSGLPSPAGAIHSLVFGSAIDVIVRVSNGYMQTNPRATNSGYSGYFGFTYVCA